MADGGEKKKGSTRGGSNRKAKSGKRYFKNPWIDDKAKESGYLIANVERLNQFLQVGLPELEKEMYSICALRELTLLDIGHGGVAYTFVRLAHALCDPQTRVPFGAWDGQGLSPRQQQCDAIRLPPYLTPSRYMGYADQRLALAFDAIGKLKKEDRKPSRDITFLEGEAGIYCVAALIGRLQKKDDVVYVSDRRLLLTPANSATNIAKLKSLLDISITVPSNELLYGKAGYLYALLWALKHVKAEDAELTDLAMKVALQVVKEGRERKFKSMFPLMYEWHDAKYLGGAHGLTGILYILLQFPALIKDAVLVTEIQSCINSLMALERSDGNYPTREDNTKDAELVQWCHGAPAFALLFAKAHEMWKMDKTLAAAKRAGECVWRLGLLKKGLGLCHGMGGNGYVFLKLFQATGEHVWYQRALHYCEFSWSKKGTNSLNTPDRPCSLFEGMGGMMCLMADCLNPAAATFPGFDL